MLAGVSLDYYTQLERGNLRGASESVLNAIARALQLNDVEREHLFDLARADHGQPGQRRQHARLDRSCAPRCSGSWTTWPCPAVVYNAQQDLVASNLMGRALFSPHFEADRPNLARFIFLDSRARDFYVDWPLACSLTAAMLRSRPAATRSTATSPPWSASSRCAARSSAGTGPTGRPRAPHRPQGLPPPRGRRDRGHLRRVRDAGRTRPVHRHLHRRRRYPSPPTSSRCSPPGQQLRINAPEHESRPTTLRRPQALHPDLPLVEPGSEVTPH